MLFGPHHCPQVWVYISHNLCHHHHSMVDIIDVLVCDVASWWSRSPKLIEQLTACLYYMRALLCRFKSFPLIPMTEISVPITSIHSTYDTSRRHLGHENVVISDGQALSVVSLTFSRRSCLGNDLFTANYNHVSTTSNFRGYGDQLHWMPP